MPRAARVAPNGNVYHVLTRGNNRQAIFNEEDDHWRYFDILRQYKERYRFKLYHYVLMTNHVHLVLETTEEGGNLAEVMKGVNLVYAWYYKKKYGHIGHFWQDRYKSILISKDSYLLACGSYVELNPVRAKMVEDPGEYRWSSYRVYALGQQDGIVDEHSIYYELSSDESERRQKYRDFVQEMIRERDGMRGEMDGRRVYGSEGFTKEVTAKHKIEEASRPQGRQLGWRKNK